MLGLSYKIVYKKGVENKVADALSRHIHEDTEELLELSVCKPVWFEDVVAGYQHDKVAQQKLEHLAVAGTQGNYTLQKSLIRHKGRIWIGCNSEIQ